MDFRSKNLLITGGAGFIGSNFIKYILSKYSDLNVINLDLMTYAGKIENISQFEKNSNYKFYKGDINDTKLLNQIFSNHKIDGVINFAAETHVDNSITSPEKFIRSNINGVFNLLNAAYNFWMKSPHKVKEKFEHARFHQISTDEVYGSTNAESFSEDSNYLPNSPYSSSKASADLIVRSFFKTFGLNTTISVCSNNYGPNQHNEKLLPKIFDCIKNNKPVNLYGNGLNVRDWIHVEDHCNAVDMIFDKGIKGSKYNVGSGTEISNIKLVKSIYKILKERENINFIEDRYGHDFRYSIKTNKIKNELGWSPKRNLNKSIKELFNL